MAIKDLVPRIGRGSGRMPVRRDSLHDFQQEINRLFDDFFAGLPAVSQLGGEHGLTSAGFLPRVDVSESGKEVKVAAEMPGMDEKDIAVEMDDEAITIRGERREEKEEKGKNWHIREQSYGSFNRRIALPVRVDGAKASAKFKKGVLTVTAPKRAEEQAKRKTVRIETD